MPRLTIDTEVDDDGRWIAEVKEIAGALAYGATREEAIRRAEALVLRVIADRLESNELAPDGSDPFAR